jgi:hypothetical protein
MDISKHDRLPVLFHSRHFPAKRMPFYIAFFEKVCAALYDAKTPTQAQLPAEDSEHPLSLARAVIKKSCKVCAAS